jgi:hypothetical protein
VKNVHMQTLDDHNIWGTDELMQKLYLVSLPLMSFHIEKK